MVQGVISKSILIGLLTISAAQAETRLQNWKIRLAGLPAAEATLRFTTTPRTYLMHMSAEMDGPLSMIFSWKHDSESTGIIHNDKIVPQTHTVTNEWQEKKSRFSLLYDLSGRIMARKNIKPEDTTLLPSSPELTENALDFLGEFVAGGLFISKHDTCPTTMPVFDGNRRYDVNITDAGVEEIDGHRARHCRMDVFPFTPEGGKRPKGWFWRRNGKNKPPGLVDIWLSKDPKLGLAVPVKLHMTSELGAIDMVLDTP